MVLCSFCENITIGGIAVDYGPKFQRWEEPPGYNHAPDYPALLESAKTCDLCRLISDCGQDDGIFPEFDPKFDIVPDQIARRNASQRLKLQAFRPGAKLKPKGPWAWRTAHLKCSGSIYLSGNGC